MSGAALVVLSSANKPRGAFIPHATNVYSTINGSTLTTSITYRSNGNYDSVGDPGDSPSGTWLSGSGTGANYEIRATPLMGLPDSGATGVWLSLGSDVTWSITDSGVKVCLMDLEIRDATTLQIYTSGGPYLELIIGY